ncbi:hypothetical protein Pcinc_036742 [Petrolisthes cinctipes]|uniref:Uncharacterized protein n=1 Tax=Petrolisthes cinctipes TaxID=88211 RepID=A0AAE1BY06_PETCI|nr:hypothetical protein Pcinc_036742 [Petrolisthes cinctipes]
MTTTTSLTMNIGGVGVTVLPLNDSHPNITASLYDQIVLNFPGAGGVGEIYHGADVNIDGPDLPPTLTGGLLMPAVAVAEGDIRRTHEVPPVREFGAEQVSVHVILVTFFIR